MTHKYEWYLEERQKYTAVALTSAFGCESADDWDPARGWRANRGRVIRLYDYYRDLYNCQPDSFLWAGLARLAGGALVNGLDAIPNDRNVLVRAFLEAGRDIFYALAWQHEAAARAPRQIVALASVHDSEVGARTSYASAWARILNGGPAEVARGNEDLLENEQYSVAQPHSETLRAAALERSGPLGRLLLRASALTLAIHPYHSDFAADFPAGDPRDGDQRWAWITLEGGMWHRWAALPANERVRLVNYDFESIVRGDFGETMDELSAHRRSVMSGPLVLRRARLVREILLSFRPVGAQASA